MARHAPILDAAAAATYWPNEAAALMQAAGIVGAGGSGFPTYAKYRAPASRLIVDAMEGEPGLYADKLLLRDEAPALVEVFGWLQTTFGIDRIVLAVEEVARPYVADLERLGRDVPGFRVAYLPAQYGLSDRRALGQAVLGTEPGWTATRRDRDAVVNNVETLLNMHQAVFRREPVVRKRVHLYGAVGPPRVFEAPVGVLLADLLELYGAPPEAHADCRLYDGGPLGGRLALERLGPEPLLPVARTTNALLVVDPEFEPSRSRHYPHEDHVDNRMDNPWAPLAVEDIADKVVRVRVPLAGRFQTGTVVVQQGDHVLPGEAVQEPSLNGVSIGAHAPINGVVIAVTPDYVEIRRD